MFTTFTIALSNKFFSDVHSEKNFLYESLTHSQNDQVFHARILRYCPQIAFQKLCLANRCQSSRLCMRPLTPSICIYPMLYLQAEKYISLSSFVKRETSNLCSLFLPSYYSHKYRNYQFVKSDVIWRPRAVSNKSSQSSTQ